jgi:site-specific DNA-methyltransferase (adenine-specific)
MYSLKENLDTIHIRETASLFVADCPPDVPVDLEDNTTEGLRLLQSANAALRQVPWPAPYDRVNHQIFQADSRDLSFIKDESIDLVVTSPPYWTLKEYEPGQAGQLGDLEDYERFLLELDRVWAECARVLKRGGRICCVVGDVCVPRKRHGRHLVMPLHADIQVRTRALGLDCLTPILWHKITNGAQEATGTGGGFYGKPYQPGAIIKNDLEYILFMRKGGGYRTVSAMQKALSMLSKDEMRQWMVSVWSDVRGASTRDGHPAPYPVEIAERLIRMFSFAGDTILDPFLGTGSTTLAAIATGRNSIGVELEPSYVRFAERRIRKDISLPRARGAMFQTLEATKVSGE